MSDMSDSFIETMKYEGWNDALLLSMVEFVNSLNVRTVNLWDKLPCEITKSVTIRTPVNKEGEISVMKLTVSIKPLT